jgi:hypothetical protein
MFFPMLTIERCNSDFSDGAWLQAAYIDAVVLRMRSRNIKGLDAAHFAKQMLGHAGVKCVGRERFRPLEKGKP